MSGAWIWHPSVVARWGKVLGSSCQVCVWKARGHPRQQQMGTVCVQLRWGWDLLRDSFLQPWSQWQCLKYSPDVESWVELMGFYSAPSLPESEPYLVFFFFIFRIYWFPCLTDKGLEEKMRVSAGNFFLNGGQCLSKSSSYNRKCFH